MTDHSRFMITRTGIGIRSGKPTTGHSSVTGTLEQARYHFQAYIDAARTFRPNIRTLTLTNADGVVLATWGYMVKGVAA